jgi:4-nitrophenyl phosphatase
VTWALDLDGVVWLAGRAIPGSAAAVSALRRAKERVVFLTNNSGPLLDGHVRSLAAVGIECAPEDVTTSAQAAAAMLGPGTTAAVVGDEGIHEALAASGVRVVGFGEQPGAVVVGRTLTMDYSTLSLAARAVREGARFVATNTDATFPTGHGGGPSGDGGDGLLPGAGALVAFVATASGHQPEVAGKPNEPMAALVRARYGRLDMVAGDRLDTDGLFAERVGAPFGLVLSGVTRRADIPAGVAPQVVADDLAGLVRSCLGARALEPPGSQS